AGREQRDRGDDEEPPHAGPHGDHHAEPMPSRRIAPRKSTFPAEAARAKKWMRPSGGGSSSATSRVRSAVTTAAASAAKATTAAATVIPICQPVTPNAQRLPLGLQRAEERMRSAACWHVHAAAPPSRPNH